jgi:Flp pilus assembly protein TadB
MVLGIALAFTNILMEMIPNYRSIMAVVLIIYGAFRMYLLFRQRKSYKFFQQQKQESLSNNSNENL